MSSVSLSLESSWPDEDATRQQQLMVLDSYVPDDDPAPPAAALVEEQVERRVELQDDREARPLLLDSVVVDDDDDGAHRERPAKYQRLESTVDRVRRLLSDEAGGSTVVLEGPPGCGKSTVCRLALARLGPSVLSVVLRGYLVGSTDASFKALLRGLESDKQARNNTELRIFLHQRLAELASMGILTVVLLEQAEIFAKQPKQPLLYLLNDLLHDATVKIKLVLTTQGQGEDRVRVLGGDCEMTPLANRV
jgi:hypothetical protein